MGMLFWVDATTGAEAAAIPLVAETLDAAPIAVLIMDGSEAGLVFGKDSCSACAAKAEATKKIISNSRSKITRAPKGLNVTQW
jgi:hypothetical protein